MRARLPRAVRSRLAIVVAVGAALGVAPAAAQRVPKVTFTAALSNSQIGLDEEVQLNFTIAVAGGGRVERFTAPPLREFEVRDTAQQRRMEMSIGGAGMQHVRIEERIYLLKARKAGSFTIGPAAVQVDGREHWSKPVQLKVLAASGAPAPTPNPPAPRGLPGMPGIPFPGLRVQPPRSSEPGDDDLFLRAVVDKQRVYVGEQITASWYVYTQSSIEKYRPLKEPKIEAFWSEDLYVPQARLRYERASHKGQEYLQALLLRKALFPLQPGRLTIGALEAEFVSQASLFVAPTGSTRRSQELPVEVLPLPAGAPAGFDPANVGRYEIAATLDRAQVAAGEAVTLKLTLKGRGNLRQLKVPPLKGLDGFKVYDPKVQDQIELGEVIQGVKTVEYLVVPQRSGELTIPPIGVPCFDPEQKRYVTLRTEPLKVSVVGEAPRGAASQSVGLSPTENVLLPSIALIRNRHSVSTRVDRVLVRPPLLAVLLALPPFLLLALVVIGRARELIRRETPRSRLRRARSGARRRLKVAEALIRSGSEQVAPAFFGELQRALYEHLEVVLGSPATGLTLAELQPFLQARGVPEETAGAVISELENCDFARFAPAAQGHDEMRAAVKRVRDLLLAIERTSAPAEAQP
jgi:hypothetical protein